jgi:hypothetical protein
MKIKVNTKDLIGDLENFPIEVVEKMLEYQYKQLGKTDIVVFQYNRNVAKKGFRWEDTDEGYEFWSEVIGKKRFYIFFERYPKLPKNVYVRGDRNNGENVIKELESRGGINKRDYSGDTDSLYFIDPITNYITMAAKMEESLQNLLKTYYTEITLPKKTIELTMEEIAEKFGVNAELLRIKK